jgi:hypothetical protein
VKVFLGGGIEAIKTVAVELLIWSRRAGNQEIEKLGSVRVNGAGVVPDGRD